MRIRIRKILIGTATLATPALVAASLVTPSAAAATPAAPKPAAVNRVRTELVAGKNLNIRPPQTHAPVGITTRAVRPNSSSDRLVHICNHSNGGVYVALAQDYQGDFASRGWWSIDNTGCRDLWARYLYVERVGNPNYHWYISPDLLSMCVVYPGPFTVFQPYSAFACSTAGGRMVSYASVPEGSGTYNWTLGP